MTVSVRCLPLACLVLLAASAHAQQSFPTPEAAAEAFVAALGTKSADEARLAAVLGPEWDQVIPHGSVDREDVDAFLARYREKRVFQKTDATHQSLAVGRDAWTLPVPLVKNANGWTFDLKAGEPEIRARRIGRNEREAEQALLAYHDAQLDYAAPTAMATGSSSTRSSSSARTGGTMACTGRTTTARRAPWARSSATIRRRANGMATATVSSPHRAHPHPAARTTTGWAMR